MRYIFGVLAVIAVAVLAVVLLSGHSSNNGTTSPKTAAGTSLINYDNANSSFRLTIEGRLVGEDRRQNFQITVSQNQRTINLISGYEDNVAKTESFSNTSAAYSTFIRALDNAGYIRVRKGITNDERGFCPLGNRYIYELNSGKNRIQRSWNDSCQVSDGTFAGSGMLIRQIFQNQISDYNQFVIGTHVID